MSDVALNFDVCWRPIFGSLARRTALLNARAYLRSETKLECVKDVGLLHEVGAPAPHSASSAAPRSSPPSNPIIKAPGRRRSPGPIVIGKPPSINLTCALGVHEPSLSLLNSLQGNGSRF